MPILLFRDVFDAKKHTQWLCRAFEHYDVYRRSPEGKQVPFTLQQTHTLVASMSGFQRWEDLSHALVCPHLPRYIDMEDDREGFVAQLAILVAQEVDERVPTRHIAAAFHFVGFGCSPKVHERAVRTAKATRNTGMTAVQLATVQWVEESFGRGTRYGVDNPEALDFLRKKVIAKYLGRPIPSKPRGVKITEGDRIYEKLLCRYLCLSA